MESINSFSGKYHFLSNFYPCEVMFQGILYPSSEHAYQAHKSLDIETREYISTLETPNLAKKAGKMLDVRNDWDEVKYEIMYEIVKAKFIQNLNLQLNLLDTGDCQIIEGNHWHDQIWGQCYCPKHYDLEGTNWLGKILMQIRDEIR